MARVPGRVKQVVDQPLALVLVGGIEKANGLLIGWNGTRNVEINAADELLVGRQRVWLNLELLVVGLDERINLCRGQTRTFGRLRIDLGQLQRLDGSLRNARQRAVLFDRRRVG